MKLFAGFLLCIATNYTKTSLKRVLVDAHSRLIFASFASSLCVIPAKAGTSSQKKVHMCDFENNKPLIA